MTPGTMPPSDIPPELAGAFPNIPQLEQAAIEQLRGKIDVVRRTIALSDALLGLGRTEHYRVFVAEVQELRSATVGKLLASKSDREASILIGQGKALDDILTLMRNESATRDRLAVSLKAMEDHLDKLTDPKKAEFLS